MVAVHGGAHEGRAAAEAYGAGMGLPVTTHIASRVMASPGDRKLNYEIASAEYTESRRLIAS